MGMLREVFEEAEIVNRLIRISVSLRILDSRITRTFPLANRLLSITGKLTPDSRFSDSEDLRMREACNKIVHAETYKIEKIDESDEQSALEPFVVLAGKYRQKTWEARVDIKEFVRDAYHATHALLSELCE